MMRKSEKILALLRLHKLSLAKEFGIKTIGLFGSYVRDEQGKSSDVDILVDFADAPNLFDFVELKDKLSSILGREVDLVPKSSLKPVIGQRILREVVFA